MKIVFIVLALVSFLFSNEQDKSGIGIGGTISQSMYEGMDNKTSVIPLIKYKYEEFYIEGIEMGYKQIDTDMFKLNYILSPRLNNYDSGDSPYLTGMDERYMTLEAGVAVMLTAIPFVNLSAKAKFDTLGVHDGYDIGFGISSFIPVNDSFFIAPTFTQLYLSSNLANYYYGVKESEATSTREAYNVGRTKLKNYGVSFIYKVTQNINTNFIVSKSILSDKIKNSPIIKDKNIISYIIGITYTF